MRPNELAGVFEAICRVSDSSEVAETLLPTLSGAAKATFAFFHHTPRGASGLTVTTWPSGSDLVERYLRDYVASCPFVPVKARARTMVLPLSREVGPTRLQRAAFYADLLRPAGLEHHVELRMGEVDVASSAGIMLCRGKRGGEFSDAELAALSRLQPALATGIQRAVALEETRLKVSALEALLSLGGADALQLVVDLADRVVHQIGPSRPWGPEVGVALRDTRHPLRVLARDLLRRARRGEASPGALRLRAVGGVELSAHVSIAHELAIVSVTERKPKPRRVVSEADLRARWDLTRAEAAVLQGLVAGHSNRAIGQLLFISPETVRTHCTKIFRKLRVSSRLEAASLAGALS